MQGFIHCVINMTVFTNKKNCAFLISHSGFEPFFQSFGHLNLIGVIDLPKHQGCRWGVLADEVLKRMQRLLSSVGQKRLFVIDSPDAHCGDAMVAFEQGIESNVSDGPMLDRRIETLNHDCFPIVAVGYRTTQAIYRAYPG